MALAVGHRRNFNTLQQAFLAGDVALMECQLATTGEAVPVLCAANRQQDGSLEFAPFAMLFSGNPYEILNPPTPGVDSSRNGRLGRSSRSQNWTAPTWGSSSTTNCEPRPAARRMPFLLRFDDGADEATASDRGKHDRGLDYAKGWVAVGS